MKFVIFTETAKLVQPSKLRSTIYRFLTAQSEETSVVSLPLARDLLRAAEWRGQTLGQSNLCRPKSPVGQSASVCTHLH